MNKTFRYFTISLFLIFSLLSNLSTAYTQPSETATISDHTRPADTLYPGLMTPRSELPQGFTPDWWDAVSRGLDIPNRPE